MNVFASALILLWTSGPIDAREVEQPSQLWRRQGENAEIDCSHTKGAGYYQMYWFRQLPGESMALVVLTVAGNDKHDFGEFSTEKFSASKPDALSGSLTVLKVEPADQGVYFCAVGAQCCRRARRFNKNPSRRLNPNDRKSMRLLHPAAVTTSNPQDHLWNVRVTDSGLI